MRKTEISRHQIYTEPHRCFYTFVNRLKSAFLVVNKRFLILLEKMDLHKDTSLETYFQIPLSFS